MSRKIGIEGLYYITHIDNIPSILARGILSHSEIEREEIELENIDAGGRNACAPTS
ncbi:MAG: DUF4433 domain-containing protein [Symploca sp. SIO2E6]|nr:DUF4433 domain-containing protein [Symploca sp. SIO2E6]